MENYKELFLKRRFSEAGFIDQSGLQKIVKFISLFIIWLYLTRTGNYQIHERTDGGL